MLKWFRFGVMCTAVVCLAVSSLCASEHHGHVKFSGLPLPGATVSATLGDKTVTSVTDGEGAYAFPDLADGTWTLQIEMLGFSPMKQEVAIFANAPSPDWELKMLPLEEIKAVATPAAPPPAAAATVSQTTTSAAVPTPPSRNGKNKKAQTAPTNTQTSFQRADLNAASGSAPAPSESTPPTVTAANQNPTELSQRAADGFLINGTANNGAASPFSQANRFGNNIRGIRSLYNGNLGLVVDNSIWDARSYSLTGQDTAKPAYNLFTGVAAFGGPLRIPHITHGNNGPNFFVNYQWTRNRTATTSQGLMPTEAEREGILSPSVKFVDPTNGQPFTGNMIPDARISQQAKALLGLYPLPNFDGGTRYNYQIPIVGVTHQDALQTRMNKAIGRKNQVAGNFALQSTRTDNPNLFGFLDTGSTLGLNFGVNWRHNFTPRFFGNFGYQFSRQAVRTTPFFANRFNVSGQAGINGNNQDPVNYGPPSLQFVSGITPLSDANFSSNRNQTSAVNYDSLWSRGRHNITFGGDFRRQQFNVLSQDNPRGVFGFTGKAAGYDFAGFLLGIPDTSTLAFGNADKYLRASSYDAYFNDDWRVSPSFTLNAGLRWEYWSPLTEVYGRLVNLDVTGNFVAESPVVASSPVGSLTGQKYPDSLIRPDKHGFQPRIAFSWRPLAASSMVVRGGYGVYYNTSVYQSIALQMVQQSPLSKSLSVSNTPDNPLTLASGFNGSPSVTQTTFGVDPNFLIGYTQNWQLSVQRDLPGSMVAIVTYSGVKGTRGMQEFFPNTYPDGAVNPCPACLPGFTYLTSNGNSIRHAGQIQLRRRLHNGFTANVQYTFAKSIDDSALGGRNQGGALVAQNWLDLAAERALSNFDQRHAVSLQAQYTTGMGVGGGTLVGGWRGALFKEWTFVTNINAGTGLPLTPIYPGASGRTGFTGQLRPHYTGAPLYAAPSGQYLNPEAYSAPLPGQWGDAGRNSITGPYQFSLNASLGRTFRLNDRLNIDWRFDATNALNHVTFPTWGTTVGGAQFGLPVSPNQMRRMVGNLRLRF